MAATGYTSTTGDARKVSKAGDAMTGDLILVDLVPDTPNSAAPRGYVDAAVEGAGGGGTPSGTVESADSFGQTPDAGVGTAYSRGDHTHGTPSLPTPAEIGALADEGDQLFTGELSFVDRIPVGPGFDPAFDNQLGRKAYIDARVDTRRAKQAYVFDVTDAPYGAVGDAQVVADGAMSSGSAILTSATANWPTSVVGKAISVKGAAATGVTTLVTTVASRQSSTQITLNAANASGGALTNGVVIWGTDDTAAIQAAVDAAEAYLVAHTYAQVFFPPRPYIVAGALNTSKSGNGQIVFGPVPTSGNKKILEFRGETDGAAAVRHWLQTVPQTAGSCLISLGVYSSTSAQISSLNAHGNPGVLGGPNEGSGYGVAANFSNMMAVVKNLAILTTHSAYGLTYGPATLWGCANAHVENFGASTAGTVASPSSDYSSPGTFGTGLSAGLLLPAPGNNDHVIAKNVSIGGGYTYAMFLTEHGLMDRYMALYCWAGLVVVGNYAGSVGSVHAMKVLSASIEACINEVYILGVGSSGIGPIIDIDQLSTESSTPNVAGQTAHMAAARGLVRWTGLFDEAGLTHDNPTGIESINAQAASAVRTVTASTTARVIDRVLKVDAASAPVTITLPSAAPNPVIYTIIKSDASGNAVTVDPVGAETINGAATRTLAAQWDSVTLRSDGSNWIAV